MVCGGLGALEDGKCGGLRMECGECAQDKACEGFLYSCAGPVQSDFVTTK